MFSRIFNRRYHNPQCAPTLQGNEDTTTFPFPTSEPVLCQFVSFLAIEQLKHKTIKSYLSSVRFLQILQCGTDPFITDLPRLTYVLREIKSEETKKDNRARPRLPVTPLLLTRIYHILLRDPTNFDNIMIWAASLTCFFGFLRSGEITVPRYT